MASERASQGGKPGSIQRLSGPTRVFVGTLRLRTAMRLTLALWLASKIGGCGAILHSMALTEAEAALQRADTNHAERLSPYAYYLAREYLIQSRLEASDAAYEAAIAHAATSRDYADRATDQARGSVP